MNPFNAASGFKDYLASKKKQAVPGVSFTGKQLQVPTSGLAPLSSNTAATQPNPVKSQAAQSYVSSLQPKPQPAPTAPQMTPLSGNVSTPSGATVNTQTGGMVTAPKVDPQQNYRDAFSQYLTSLQPSSAETEASKYLSSLTLQQKKDQEEALNRGESLGFATGEAQRVNRNNAFAIEGASNALNAFTSQRQAMSEAQKARLDFEKSLLGENKPIEINGQLVQKNPNTGAYESVFSSSKPQEGFTLGKGQVRYDANGNVIAGIGEAGSLGGGTYVAGSNPSVDAYVKGIQSGRFKASDIPDEYKDQVAQGLSSAGASTSPTAKTVVSLVDELLSDTASLGAITGLVQSSFIPGTKGALTSNIYEQLKGLLSLENRQLLKGSGAISDYEFKVLEKASSSLGRNLSEEQFRDRLKKLKEDLSVPNGGIAPDEEEALRQQGFTQQEIDELKGESFNKVGKTSASIPKTSRLASVNNNPGNLRFAGQVGATRGEKGFARFETPEAGINALENQIKLDASRNLTLAQFVNKYAPPSENDTQKYIQDVIAFTGAKKNTPLKQIDLKKLTRAIAQKESGTII